jgi:hypothetical protein
VLSAAQQEELYVFYATARYAKWTRPDIETVCVQMPPNAPSRLALTLDYYWETAQSPLEIGAVVYRAHCYREEPKLFLRIEDAEAYIRRRRCEDARRLALDPIAFDSDQPPGTFAAQQGKGLLVRRVREEDASAAIANGRLVGSLDGNRLNPVHPAIMRERMREFATSGYYFDGSFTNHRGSYFPVEQINYTDIRELDCVYYTYGPFSPVLWCHSVDIARTAYLADHEPWRARDLPLSLLVGHLDAYLHACGARSARYPPCWTMPIYSVETLCMRLPDRFGRRLIP